MAAILTTFALISGTVKRSAIYLLQPTNRLPERLSPVSESVLIYHMLVSVWSVLELNQLPV